MFPELVKTEYFVGRYFSWHAFTSTSLYKHEALKFSKSYKGRTPVLFSVLVDYTDEVLESCAFVNLNEISVFPGEQEILMAPGGIF